MFVYLPSAWTEESPIFFMQWQPVRCYQNFKWNRNWGWTLDHRFFNCPSARIFLFQLNLLEINKLDEFIIIRLQLTKKYWEIRRLATATEQEFYHGWSTINICLGDSSDLNNYCSVCCPVVLLCEMGGECMLESVALSFTILLSRTLLSF